MSTEPNICFVVVDPTTLLPIETSMADRGLYVRVRKYAAYSGYNGIKLHNIQRVRGQAPGMSFIFGFGCDDPEKRIIIQAFTASPDVIRLNAFCD